MKSLFNKYIWLQLILSILLLFGGGLIIAFAISGKEEVLKDGLNLVVAVTLFIFGLFAILTAFLFEARKFLTAGFLYGSICIALGVFLCVRKFFLLEYIVLILSIFFIVIGSAALVKSFVMVARRYRDSGLIAATLVIGIVCIALGILSLIFQDKMVNVFCIIAGFLLVGAGIFELVMGVRGILGHGKGSKNNKKSSRKAASKGEPKQEEVKELDYTKTEE